jgi:hypothetical protein
MASSRLPGRADPLRSNRTCGWSGDRRRRSRAQQARFVRHTRIIVTQYGGPLHVVEEECPEPKKGEVRVRVLAAGVSLPDLLMCEGVHPETPRLPFTPGWDVIGMVDRLGDGISGIQPGQIVAALPIHGAYAEFVCLPQRELVPVPAGLDAAEAVSLVLNYVTAHQMLHRSAKVKPGQRVLIHGAAGGVGSALLQLGRLARLEMYGTCSSRGASAVSMWSSTASVAPTSGAPARRSVLEGPWWPMASLARCVAGDWLQVVQAVVIAFVKSPSSGCTSREAGFSRVGNGWSPTASSGSNG